MDFRKLEVFLRVAQLQSFSQAAEALHMAQPAVSIAVRKLEQELGLSLFDRSGRHISLTVEGEKLRAGAGAILADLNTLRRSMADNLALLEGEINICCPSMLATYFLPDMLTDFLSEHPGLQASVTQAGTGRIEELLLANDIEVGVITSTDSKNLAQFELVPLVRERMLLCVGRKHPLAKRRNIQVSELHNCPMVLYESGYFIRHKLDQLCADEGVTVDVRMQTNFLPLLTKMVSQGLGCTVGLGVMARGETNIVGVPILPKIEVSMALAKRRGRTISRANQAFFDWAEQRRTTSG